MDAQTKERLNEYSKAASNDKAMEAFWEKMNAKLTAEVKAMESMSREQLIQYAAETRVYMTEMQNHVNICLEGMQLQQRMINDLAEAVNGLITKKKVCLVDIAKIQQGKYDC